MHRTELPLQPDTLMVGLVAIIASLEFGQAVVIGERMRDRLPRWPGVDPRTVAEVLALLDAKAELDHWPIHPRPVPAED